MGYKKPILKEIYCEIFLSGDGFGSGFVEMVSDFKTIGLTEVELAPIKQFHVTAPANDDPKVRRDNIPRVRIWSGDRKKLAQLSKSQLVVNLIEPYPGWAEFKSLFDGVWNQAKTRYSTIKVESIMLSTIDKVDLPASNFTIGKYFNTEGSYIPKGYKDVANASDIILGQGIVKVDGFNKQAQLKFVPNGTHFEATIHNKFHKLLGSADNLSDILDNLHDESNEVFEDMITDTMRNQIMGGLV